MDALEARLRRLEDLEAIRRLLVDIARGLDRFDRTVLAQAVVEDAVLDMGGGEAKTGAAFVAAIQPPAAARPGRTHLVCNERIELDGDLAKSESYVVSCQDLLVDGVQKTRIRAGRYLDRWERRHGEWKLAARTLVDEWGRIDSVREAIQPGTHQGRPAPDDLSYRT